MLWFNQQAIWIKKFYLNSVEVCPNVIAVRCVWSMCIFDQMRSASNQLTKCAPFGQEHKAQHWTKCACIGHLCYTFGQMQYRPVTYQLPRIDIINGDCNHVLHYLLLPQFQRFQLCPTSTSTQFRTGHLMEKNYMQHMPYLNKLILTLWFWIQF